MSSRTEFSDRMQDDYARGYDAGHEEGYQAALDECGLDIPEPADLLNRMESWRWQDYYDRLKAEAARLGVRV